MKILLFTFLFLPFLATLNAQIKISDFVITDEAEINTQIVKFLETNVMASFTNGVSFAYSKGDNYSTF